jgi:hypothetical protein
MSAVQMEKGRDVLTYRTRPISLYDVEGRPGYITSNVSPNSTINATLGSAKLATLHSLFFLLAKWETYPRANSSRQNLLSARFDSAVSTCQSTHNKLILIPPILPNAARPISVYPDRLPSARISLANSLALSSVFSLEKKGKGLIANPLC